LFLLLGTIDGQLNSALSLLRLLIGSAPARQHLESAVSRSSGLTLAPPR
jgi:hypothetical protein